MRPALANVTLTFDDLAPSNLPLVGALTGGVYRPTNFDLMDSFTNPAPPGPYSATLSALAGVPPNGVWSLYVYDDTHRDEGSLAGWSLSLLTGTIVSPPAPLLLSPLINANGRLQFTLQGRIGSTYEIQASADLLQWSAVLALSLAAETATFEDAGTPGPARRFYRAWQRP